jgi:hypothetical protein
MSADTVAVDMAAAKAARIAEMESRVKLNQEIRALEEKYRDPWVKRHRLREYRFSGHNLMKLIRSAPNAHEKANRVAILKKKIGGWSWDFPAMDHPELWGRDGLPLVMIGHPYGIDHDGNLRLFDLLAEIGLEVRINSRSWYGFGTCHVEIAHPSLYAKETIQ